MKTLRPLLPVLLLLGLMTISLLAIQGLVLADKANIWVPKPEDTAAEFVNALSANRYAGAENELSDELKSQVSMRELQSLADALNKKNDGLIQANGTQSDERGEGDNATSTAVVEMKFQNGDQSSLSFPLKRQNGIWSLSSIQPLAAFLGVNGK